jgi:hypothetical protein
MEMGSIAQILESSIDIVTSIHQVYLLDSQRNRLYMGNHVVVVSGVSATSYYAPSYLVSPGSARSPNPSRRQ